jgi:hypothetical protein
MEEPVATVKLISAEGHVFVVRRLTAPRYTRCVGQLP